MTTRDVVTRERIQQRIWERVDQHQRWASLKTEKVRVTTINVLVGWLNLAVDKGHDVEERALEELAAECQAWLEALSAPPTT